MQSTMIPAVVKEGKFDGTLVVKELTFDERYDLAEHLEADGTKGTKAIRLVLAKHADKVVSIDLTRKSDGQKLTAWSELEYGADCHSVRRDVALFLLGGQDRVDQQIEKKKDEKPAAASAEGNSKA